MALGATIQRFSINLSDIDRNVYEILDVRFAQHPSESDVYLVARAIAYALEYQEGIQAGRGVSSPDEPTFWIASDTGEIQCWIEVGLPSPDRLNKITKRTEILKIYAHKKVEDLNAYSQIFGTDRVHVTVLSPSILADISQTLDRQNEWELVKNDGGVFLTVMDQTFEFSLPELRIDI